MDFIIATLEEARQALQKKFAESQTTRLLTPTESINYLGIAYFATLQKILTAEYPLHPFEIVVNCGNNPGYILSGIRQGLKFFTVEGLPSTTITKLQQIVSAVNGYVKEARVSK